jgi:hypothetical protein
MLSSALPTVRAASVQNLQSILMKDNEHPDTYGRGYAEFGQEHWQSYPHYTQHMSVTVSLPDPAYKNYPNQHVQVTCDVPRAMAHLSWREGIVQSFDSDEEKMILCGYLLGSSADAHKGFLGLARTIGRALKSGEAQPLTRKRIGDESLGYTYTPGLGISQYDAVFRRANAVVELTYKGFTAYPSAQFLTEFRAIERRVHVQ